MTDNLDNLTDAELNEVVAVEVAGIGPEWVLMKRGLYYRPDAHGYTYRIEEAWRLSEEEARKHVYPHDEPVTMHRAAWRPYATSADAVLPLLEKADFYMDRTAAGGWRVVIMDPHEGPPAESVSTAFARSACLAIVRHARAQKVKP